MLNVAPLFMCAGGDCRDKDKCLRHTAKADDRQSWLERPPHDGDGCSWFMPKEQSDERDRAAA